MEQIYGRTLPGAPDNDDDRTVAEPQVTGKHREYLESRVAEWLVSVPEGGYEEGQRKLDMEQSKDWIKTAKTLRRVAVNEEIKRAGSRVGKRFYPEGFW